MGYSRKNPQPVTEGMLENLTGGGVNSSGNSDGRGALNLKIHSLTEVTFDFMFQSLQSMSFQKIALCFQILLFFQTTDLLPHLSFHP